MNNAHPCLLCHAITSPAWGRGGSRKPQIVKQKKTMTAFSTLISSRTGNSGAYFLSGFMTVGMFPWLAIRGLDLNFTVLLRFSTVAPAMVDGTGSLTEPWVPQDRTTALLLALLSLVYPPTPPHPASLPHCTIFWLASRQIANVRHATAAGSSCVRRCAGGHGATLPRPPNTWRFRTTVRRLSL